MSGRKRRIEKEKQEDEEVKEESGDGRKKRY